MQRKKAGNNFQHAQAVFERLLHAGTEEEASQLYNVIQNEGKQHWQKLLQLFLQKEATFPKFQHYLACQFLSACNAQAKSAIISRYVKLLVTPPASFQEKDESSDTLNADYLLIILQPSTNAERAQVSKYLQDYWLPKEHLLRSVCKFCILHNLPLRVLSRVSEDAVDTDANREVFFEYCAQFPSLAYEKKYGQVMQRVLCDATTNVNLHKTAMNMLELLIALIEQDERIDANMYFIFLGYFCSALYLCLLICFP